MFAISKDGVIFLKESYIVNNIESCVSSDKDIGTKPVPESASFAISNWYLPRYEILLCTEEFDRLHL